MNRKILVLALAAGLIILFFALGLHRHLTLESLKASQQGLAELYARHSLAFLAGYFVLYVAMAALSLPGAAVATLAGGAIFGFWTGLLVVSFASSLGATLACLAARYLLRDAVQGRFGDRLAAINAGIEREGAFYLFTLRLVPLFPFFVINLVMGLTPMRLFTFYWVSQLGMLPGTAVYVNAGKELGKLDSLSGILSPSLIFSFVLLGLFPLLARKALGWLRPAAGR